MKKILVLVMVLLLSGCDNTGAEKYWDYGNDEVLEQIETLASNLEQTFKNMNLDFKEIQDRLDTIDMKIDGIEVEREDMEVSFYHMNNITFNLYSITTVAIYESDPSNYKIKVICYGEQANEINYNSDNLDQMIRHYNGLVTALGELDDVEDDDTYDKDKVIEYIGDILYALLVDDSGEFTYVDDVLCVYDDGELDWCLPIEQLVEEDLG
jgi:hypothetical protein